MVWVRFTKIKFCCWKSLRRSPVTSRLFETETRWTTTYDVKSLRRHRISRNDCSVHGFNPIDLIGYRLTQRTKEKSQNIGSPEEGYRLPTLRNVAPSHDFLSFPPSMFWKFLIRVLTTLQCRWRMRTSYRLVFWLSRIFPLFRLRWRTIFITISIYSYSLW